MIKVKFIPQAWINDYAVDVDADGPQEFEVNDLPADEFHNGVYVGDEDITQHPNAPEWVKKWYGPWSLRVLA